MDERVRLRTMKILERRAKYLARIKCIKRKTKNKIAKQKKLRLTLKKQMKQM